ncbi:MAG TPA: hypothetical protein PKD17_18365, partial [Cellvibrionaceae bacterium]|nr:hypothetical protein [Cellvibrionaceae bacterium]
DLFSENLAQLRRAIDTSDGAQLHGIFSRAKAARDHFTAILSNQAAGLPSPDASRWIIAPGIKARGEVFLPGNCPFTAHVLVLAILSKQPSQVRGLELSAQHQLLIDTLRSASITIDLLNSQVNQQTTWGDIKISAKDFNGIDLNNSQACQLGELLGPLLIICLAAKTPSRWDLTSINPRDLTHLTQLWHTLFAEVLPVKDNQLSIEPRQVAGGLADCQGNIFQAFTYAISAPISQNNWVISGITGQDGQVAQAVHLSKQMGLLLNSLG